MPHTISAIILKGDYDKTKAQTFDLIGIDLGFDLTLFHIDHYYSACWQKKLGTTGHLAVGDTQGLIFPTEQVLRILMQKISNTPSPLFAIIATNYQGGFGYQAGFVYTDDARVPNIETINDALAYLGVEKKENTDEFDTVGLSQHRSSPDYLDHYFDLADELGV